MGRCVLRTNNGTSTYVKRIGTWPKIHEDQEMQNVKYKLREIREAPKSTWSKIHRDQELTILRSAETESHRV